MIETELVLLRHGQAHCNLDGVVGGPLTCTGLTDHGATQVVQAACRLAAEHARQPFDILLAGPRRRLRQTGQVLADTLHLPLTVEPVLDGPVHGDADGKPWRTVKDQHDGGPHAHPDTPWAAGSDTWNGYLHRAGLDLQHLIDTHRGQRLLLAAHGETVQALHTLLLGVVDQAAVGFTVDHASLTRWQHHRNQRGQRRWLLQQHNDTGHLTQEAIA